VYPNPFATAFQVNANAEQNGIVKLNLFDATGRLVLQQQWEQVTGNWSKSISVSNIVKGLYWLELVSENKKERVRVFRE
jgi:hypothetical protein